METILTAIRQKSNRLPATTDPDLERFLLYCRIAQLRGMLEIVNLLTDADVQIPAIVQGHIKAEIDRLNSQGG